MPIAIRSGHGLALALSVLLAPAALAQGPAAPAPENPDPPPMSARDLVTLPRLGGAVTNAAGSLAIATVTLTDAATLKRSATHQLIDLARPGTPAVPLNLALPAILPSGRMASSIFSAAHTPIPPPRRAGGCGG
jgi:hypothetical protein